MCGTWDFNCIILGLDWLGLDWIETAGIWDYCMGLSYGKGVERIVSLSGESSVEAKACGLGPDG